MGKSARLTFLCLEFGPDVHEGGIELVVEVNRIFLGHVGGEHEGQDSVGYPTLDRMDPDDLSANHEVQALAHVAHRFLLQVHGAPAVEGEPKGEHPIVRVFRHDVRNGPELDLHEVVLVEKRDGGGAFEEDSGAHRDLVRIVPLPAGREEKGG